MNDRLKIDRAALEVDAAAEAKRAKRKITTRCADGAPGARGKGDAPGGDADSDGDAGEPAH